MLKASCLRDVDGDCLRVETDEPAFRRRQQQRPHRRVGGRVGNVEQAGAGCRRREVGKWVLRLEAGGGAVALPLRDDVVTDGGIPDKVLANAPDRMGEYFGVPKVVE